MATHKSALKRARQSKERRLRNMGHKTRVKKVVKEVRTAVANNAVDEAKEAFIRAVSILQKTTSKGLIHKKGASRRISRLARQVNRLTSS